MDHVITPTFPEKHLPRLSCVAYIILDPSTISKFLLQVDDLDREANSNALAIAHDTIARAMRTITLAGLLANPTVGPDERAPIAVLQELWPRIWEWICFHDNFRDHDIFDFGKPAVAMYHAHVCMIHTLVRHSALKAQLYATPGLWELLGRAWAIFVETREYNGQGIIQLAEIILWHSSSIAESVLDDSRVVNDLVAGVGGLQELARICVKSLDTTFPHDPSLQLPLTPLAQATASTVLTLLKCHPLHESTVFHKTLSELGAVAPLVRVLLRVLHEYPVPRTRVNERGIIFATFSALFRAVLAINESDPVPGYLEALKAGLLPASHNFYSGIEPEEHVAHLPALLFSTHIMTSPLILEELSKWDLKKVEDTSGFVDPALAEAWRNVYTLIESRLTTFSAHNVMRGSVRRGCSNPRCEELHPREVMKWCTLCHLTQYCSKDCQREDWHARHTIYCDAPVFDDIDPGRIYRRRRSFMRSLLNEEYTKHEEDIARQLLQFFIVHREHATPYVLFSYTEVNTPNCEVTVGAITQHKSLVSTYREDMDRAMCSDGRYHLHFLTLPGRPDAPDRWMFYPFHSVVGVLEPGLRRLAERVKQENTSTGAEVDTEGYAEEIRRLLEQERGEGGLQTH
ncbi:MYND-type domain-containing protein [Mycena indigotica]|uniref:MYND-type domain-containing protein n=1 Tax=Mycena indigotica TaxID=2126181 RepID=A0A8H6W2Z8_9AGAR|nr:MYND-type domain-containing protein [Mycena indigotica]KAF7297459.1 MYND-type domain-containing protein [Mycena indigotica]